MTWKMISTTVECNFDLAVINLMYVTPVLARSSDVSKNMFLIFVEVVMYFACLITKSEWEANGIHLFLYFFASCIKMVLPRPTKRYTFARFEN